MTYLAAPYYQGDGSAFASYNCVPSTGTELVDMATVGRLRIPAWKIRAASGDFSGGIEYSRLAETVGNMTDGIVILDVLRLDNRGQLRDLSVSGRTAGVIISCAVTKDTARRTGGATWTFTGIHSVCARQYRWVPTGGTCRCELETTKQHGEFLVEDPGTTAGWLWWSADLLYRAAEQGGAGDIWTISTRDTEGVKRAARARGNMRALPKITALDVGNVATGRVYYVAETVNGGAWKRADGTTANGWHHLSGGGYVKGSLLR